MNRSYAGMVRNSWETQCQHNSADNLQQIIVHLDSTGSCEESSSERLDQGSEKRVDIK